MNSDEYDHIDDYISNEAKIDIRTRILISDFAILWNKYENRFHGKEYDPRGLKDFVKEIVDKYDISDNGYESAIIKHQFESLQNYIKYRCNGEYECHRVIKQFDIWRKVKNRNTGEENEKKDIEEGDLKRIMNAKNSTDRLHFLLLVIARVRNNMFHGAKGLTDLKNQRRLFIICNETLLLILNLKNKA